MEERNKNTLINISKIYQSVNYYLFKLLSKYYS
jgi:hypothetical protein